MKIYNSGPNASLDQVVLFPFDDHSIPFQRGVRLQLVGYQSSAEGGTRVVVPLGSPGAPDDGAVFYYGAVCRVGDELLMWYLGRPSVEGFRGRVCFARSRDGYHWEKPALGLVEYGDSTQNNLVDLGDQELVSALTAMYEPEDPDPSRRFKMVYETNPPPGGAKFNVAFSGDGVRWKPQPVTPAKLSCEMSGLTKFNGCYHVCVQSGGGHFGPDRQLQTFVSYDFQHWMAASCSSFMRGNIPPRPVISGSHAGEQVHLGAGLWNRGNVVLGVYGQWHGHPTNDRRLVSIDLGLVVSQDVLHFREPIPDFRFVAASEDSYASGSAGRELRFPALEQGQGFENIGDETLFWYGSWSYNDGVRLATWPRDRLGYFGAFLARKMRSLQEAHFISAPIDLEGKPASVYLNVDGLSDDSRISVEILDERFEPIHDYSEQACVSPSQSGLRQPVGWQSHEQIEGVDGPVRIRVNFRGKRPEDVKIYAVYVEESRSV